MTDDTTPDGAACKSGSGFTVPGTEETVCPEDADLALCAHCGATLSPNSEFCQVCSVAVSGGESPGDHETHDHDHDAASDGDA